MTLMGIRPMVRVLALVIATAFSWSAWAACVEGAVTASNAMACCKDGELSCAPHGSAPDCCAIDATRPQASAAHAKIQPIHTLQLIFSWSPRLDAVPADSSMIVAEVPVEPDPPPYIEFSSLLI